MHSDPQMVLMLYNVMWHPAWLPGG